MRSKENVSSKGWMGCERIKRIVEAEVREVIKLNRIASIIA
jgi:hypothetical protein